MLLQEWGTKYDGVWHFRHATLRKVGGRLVSGITPVYDLVSFLQDATGVRRGLPVTFSGPVSRPLIHLSFALEKSPALFSGVTASFAAGRPFVLYSEVSPVLRQVKLFVAGRASGDDLLAAYAASFHGHPGLAKFLRENNIEFS